MLGLGFAAFMAFLLIVGGAFTCLYLLLYRPDFSRPLLTGIVVAWAALAVFQWRSVALIAQGLESVPPPVPINIALRQALRPRLLRPAVCAWWLANAAALLVLAHYLDVGFRIPYPSPAERVVQRVTTLTLLFAGAYASNLYLLLATTAVTHRERTVTAVWRWRFALDIALAFAVFWANRHGAR